MTPADLDGDPGDPAIAQVLDIAAESDRLLIGNDPAEVGRFMTDDWVYVGPTGPVTKDETIGWIRDGRLAHHSMESVGITRARRVGDTVIVTARRQSTGTWEGTAYAVEEWITTVYVQTADGWRSAFSQKTEVA